jgi:hypothetical protein
MRFIELITVFSESQVQQPTRAFRSGHCEQCFNEDIADGSHDDAVAAIVVEM